MKSSNATSTQLVQGDVLFIASGDASHVQTAMRALRASYPDATFDVVARQEALTAFIGMDYCRVIHVTGNAQGRVRLVRHLRQTGYATVAFVEADSGEFVALQVLALFVGAMNILFADETGSIVPVGANTTLLRHVVHRVQARWHSILYSAVRSLLRTVLTPVGLVVLLVRTAIVLSRCRQTPTRLT